MFQPKINEKSRVMATKEEGAPPTFEELYKQAALLRQRREAKLNELEEKRKAKELENVTFKPVTNMSKSPMTRLKKVTEPKNIQEYTSKQYVEICKEIEKQANNPHLSLMGQKNDDLYMLLNADYKTNTSPSKGAGALSSYASIALKNKQTEAKEATRFDTSPGVPTEKSFSKSSYLSMHLNKKAHLFNQIKSDQEQKMMQLSKVSK